MATKIRTTNPTRRTVLMGGVPVCIAVAAMPGAAADTQLHQRLAQCEEALQSYTDTPTMAEKDAACDRYLDACIAVYEQPAKSLDGVIRKLHHMLAGPYGCDMPKIETEAINQILADLEALAA